MSEDLKAIAERHVKEGQRVVGRQRELIAKKKALGQDTAASEDLLDIFERTLARFEEDLQVILKRRWGPPQLAASSFPPQRNSNEEQSK
jgi:hypothetical protein